MLANPWVILVVVVTLGASHWYAYQKGGEHRENAIVAAQQKRERELAEAAKEDARARAANAKLNRGLDDEVSRYVSTDDRSRARCFDDDELQLLRSISRGQLPAMPGKQVP